MKKVYRALYLVICLVFGGTVGALASSGIIGIAIAGPVFLLGVAVLTFPFGSLPFVAAYVLLYFGQITPIELFILSTLVCTGFGYWQWFHLLPRVFRRRQQTGAVEKVFD